MGIIGSLMGGHSVSPLAVPGISLVSIVLSVEMFGAANLHLFARVGVICFVLSGKSGLYASQIIQFSKAAEIGKHETPTHTK